jgi:hypothetical protein
MIFKLGTVYNNVDKHGGGLIQVQLIEDRNKTADELPWCMPVLPKHLHVHPKEGELVMVFANSVDELYGNHLRWFIGPVITQLNKLHFQDSRSAQSFSKDGFFSPGTNPSFYTGSEGVYPEHSAAKERNGNSEFGDNVGILGRHGEDILLKENEIWIRSGVHRTDEGNKDKQVFDRPAYIKQKKYDGARSYTNLNNLFLNDIKKEMNYQTSTTIVADEINLISSSSQTSNQEKPFDLYHSKELVNEETMKRILEKCHRLPFGDVLIEFLSLFHYIFLNHAHIEGNAQNPPAPVGNGKMTSDFPKEFLLVDFNKMISNNVRIN